MGKPNVSADADDTLTIWLAGDSTVMDGTACPVGWGQYFPAFFDERVRVVNAGLSGRSVRSWLYELSAWPDANGECAQVLADDGEPVLRPSWRHMLAGMRPGDYLFVQFGINDASPNCIRHVGLEAFQAEYGMMAAAARERGTEPVFVTPVSAIACDGDEARGTRGDFVGATIAAGARYGVPVIDLHARSVELYDQLGFCPLTSAAGAGGSEMSGVDQFFCGDHTHFAAPGAFVIAGLVVEGLRDAALPLADDLK